MTVNDELLVELVDSEIASIIRRLDQSDPEESHHYADRILVDLVKRCGFHKTAVAFDELKKWYA